ncbi:MAG TPA: hypothetical protein VFC78_24865 [Tepidisphaeraceae bacterium]|nr:hypothetical protein [Tepidisphaeraceae bacterium]
MQSAIASPFHNGIGIIGRVTLPGNPCPEMFVMQKPIPAICLSLILCASTFGGVIYEPVQYQYGPIQPHGNGSIEYYYYGGAHPDAVRASVQLNYDRFQYGPNIQPHNFTSRASQVPLVYLSGPGPKVNMAAYGYTDTDAYNEAQANVPRYFRKADLLRAARIAPDGTAVVPAQAKPVPALIQIRPLNPATTRPAAQPILIIPKKLLEQAKPVDVKVAAAR